MLMQIILLIAMLALIFFGSCLATMMTSYPYDMAERRRNGIPTETRWRYIAGNFAEMFGYRR